MRTTPRIIAAVLGGAASAILLIGCTAPTTPTASPTTTASANPAALSGTAGAAHFDEGFLQVGTRGRVVDLYVDPMCPYCKLFDETSGSRLLDDAAAGTTTLRIHPVAILNRLSQGTGYSTRAAAVLTAVAAEHPTALPAFFQALYAQQPAENTAGHDDAALLRIARSVGADLQGSTGQLTAYQAWVDQATAAATAGPVPATTDVPAIRQVPTVIVNGAVFPGNSDDEDAFTTFYNQH